MKERYYDLLNIKNDFVFKAVFGREDDECRIILKGLLNAILNLEDSKQIKEIMSVYWGYIPRLQAKPLG